MSRKKTRRRLRSRPTRLIILVAMILVATVGCAIDRFRWRPPFGASDAAVSPTSGQASLAARIDRLEGLQKRAKRMDAAEQSQIAASMSKSYLQESEPSVRLAMARTFGYFSTPAAIPGLEAALTDANPDIRIEAVRSLGRMASPQALTLLIATYRSDTNVDVRIAATRQLGHFESNQAINALGQSLDDADPAIQYLAMQSLRNATGKNLGNDVRQWKQLVNAAAAGGTTPETNSRENVAGRAADLR